MTKLSTFVIVFFGIAFLCDSLEVKETQVNICYKVTVLIYKINQINKKCLSSYWDILIDLRYLYWRNIWQADLSKISIWPLFNLTAVLNSRDIKSSCVIKSISVCAHVHSC